MPAATLRPPRIYVEILIKGSLDRVWELTQTPSLHQRWDARFSEITYLPRPDPALPQRFLYATRIGFGLRIRGEGESTGTHESASGERTSALKFWSDHPLSLIREGSGYWKYVPLHEPAGAVRFFTEYDYRVRFGVPGRLFDRLLFRPLIGWATAWSFDRLRLWIERDIDPAVSMQRSLVHAIARVAVASIWLYHGVVPKLLHRDAAELDMLHAAGFSATRAPSICTAMGVAETLFGLALLFFWRSHLLLWLTLAAMPLALLAVAIQSPAYLAAAFNPVSLNLAVFALSLIALLTRSDLPSAARCVRRPSRPPP